ncbi:MAG TPA: hypothetical protein VFZ77_20035 [Acidimicrobiales bacterium]
MGVAVPPGPLAAWMCRCIDRLAAEPGVRLALVVRPDEASVRPGARPAPGAGRTVRRSAALRPAAPPRPLDGVPVVRTLGDPEVARLDVLLDMTGAIDVDPTGQGRPGVPTWQFGFGPRMVADACVAAALDLVERRRTATVALLAAGPDSRVVLRQGRIAVPSHSLAAHLDSLLLRAADWPAVVCRDLAGAGRSAGGTSICGDGPGDDAAPALRAGPTGARGGAPGRARLAWREAANRLSHGLRFLRDDQWHVGVVDAPISSFLRPERLPAPRWLPEPSRHIVYADPFPFDGGRSVVLEHLSLRRRIGTLCAIDLADAAARPRPLLSPGHHVAYPYVVEHAGRSYCVPETAAAGEIGLYDFCDDPPRLEKVATLVDGVAAVDPTVTRHGGRWWLFFTDGAGDVEADLHVWHAPDLLGPWAPHARNPVKVDVASARPAGTPFVVGGVLHRPAMDNSLTYGGCVVINRIERLTPDDFQERTVAVVPPFAGPFGRGIHTLAAAGPVTVIDGKRVRTIPTALPAKLRARASAHSRSQTVAGGWPGHSTAGAPRRTGQ